MTKEYSSNTYGVIVNFSHPSLSVAFIILYYTFGKHSKWLTFIERRLKLAKQLLNLDDSVLIVTIDEVECARLALLLEQTFPTATIQMITSVISRNGTSRENEFNRVEEYIFICRFGDMVVKRTNDNMLSEGEEGIIKKRLSH